MRGPEQVVPHMQQVVSRRRGGARKIAIPERIDDVTVLVLVLEPALGSDAAAFQEAPFGL